MSKTLLVGELDNAPGDIASLKKDLNEASAEQGTLNQEPAGDENDLTDIPEKYRGKSRAEIIEMHQNAESELGRHGNELGQYKTLTDQLLQQKRSDDLLAGGATEEQIDEFEIPEIDSTKLLADPANVIGDIVKGAINHDRQIRTKDEQKRTAETVAEKFAAKHPDAETVANSKEFIEWVKKSPTRALNGMNAANGDLTAGDALLTEWKELQQNSDSGNSENEDPNTQERTNLAAARKAGTESTGANNTNDKPTGKIYRRLDMIRLKLEDPEAYADPAYQAEIMKAYAEGRVK